MRKKEGKDGKRIDRDSKKSQDINFLLNRLSDKDKKELDDLKKGLFREIIEKRELIKNVLRILDVEELKVPVNIFVSELTVLESVVKYLKEEKNLLFVEIARLIKRDQRNIWHCYNYSKLKYPKRFKYDISRILIPVSIFENRELSPLENLVFYMRKDLGFKFVEIARLLQRDSRTIWTVYERARKKNER